MSEKQKKIVIQLPSIPGILTIVFVVLKLINVINWSWVWVLSPLWIELAAYLVIIAISLVVIYFIKKREEKEFGDFWKY